MYLRECGQSFQVEELKEETFYIFQKRKKKEETTEQASVSEIRRHQDISKWQ